jgi:hypothetical protein
MDTCPRASRAHISKEREKWIKVLGEKSSPLQEWKAQILKILEREI